MTIMEEVGFSLAVAVAVVAGFRFVALMWEPALGVGSWFAKWIVKSQAWSVQRCLRPHMMVSPSRADLGRSRSKGLSFSAGLPLQTSHPAGVDPSHCPAFGTGRAPR